MCTARAVRRRTRRRTCGCARHRCEPSYLHLQRSSGAGSGAPGRSCNSSASKAKAGLGGWEERGSTWCVCGGGLGRAAAARATPTALRAEAGRAEAVACCAARARQVVAAITTVLFAHSGGTAGPTPRATTTASEEASRPAAGRLARAAAQASLQVPGLHAGLASRSTGPRDSMFAPFTITGGLTVVLRLDLVSTTKLD